VEEMCWTPGVDRQELVEARAAAQEELVSAQGELDAARAQAGVDRKELEEEGARVRKELAAALEDLAAAREEGVDRQEQDQTDTMLEAARGEAAAAKDQAEKLLEEARGEVVGVSGELAVAREELTALREATDNAEEMRGALDAARAQAGVDSQELAEMRGALDDTRAQLGVRHEELEAVRVPPRERASERKRGCVCVCERESV
jgi:chromosome segregation ATPase